MCGIIGYIGARNAAPILFDGLRRIEYRGYDSAGIATVEGKIYVKKDKGKIDEIHARVNFLELPGKIGIGHTRWATHGEPSQKNAHPHLDSSERVAVVHNGVIENYLELKRRLEKAGCRFSSETDTEVIPNLIAYFMKKGRTLEDAVRRAALKLRGSFAIAVVSVAEPEKIICVRKESPLIIGIGKGEMFLASDIPAVLPWTKKVIVLEDGDMATVKSDGVAIKSYITGRVVRRRPMKVTWTIEMAEKGGYPHFTLKEIFQQPDAVRETLRAGEREMSRLIDMMMKAKRIYFVACGTSYHAALVGKYALKKLAKIPVEAVISSEFPESCHVDGKTLVLAITQSGETADTLRAARVAKAGGAKLTCLTNVLGSSITRESDLSLYTFAGPEV
ncbi:MAG: glutamine--fructose-6-phosphate transaminase (isomerizing), partial [Candidatus Hadarchaeales archaeon]